MKRLSWNRFVALASLGGAALLAAPQVRADSFEIVGTFVTSNQGPGYGGSFVLTYSATGLPAAPPVAYFVGGTPVPLTNVDLMATLTNGTVVSVTNSTGQIFSENTGQIFDYLSAGNSTGDVDLVLASGFDGVGPVLPTSNDVASFISLTLPGVGVDTGDVTSGTSFARTPEPSSIALGALAIALSGLTFLLRTRAAKA